jgi:glycyl-tRNA synthetase beta chain
MAVYELGFDDLPAKYLILLSQKKKKFQRKSESQIYLSPRRIIIKTQSQIEPQKIIEFLTENYKTMRWKEGEKISFVRPLRWILALSGENKIDIEIFGVKSGCATYPHRALGNTKVDVEKEEEFFEKLKEGKVEFSENARREKIKKILQDSGLDPENYKELIEISTFLTEHPKGVIGKVDSEGIPEAIAEDILKNTVLVFPIKNEGKISGFVAIIDNPSPSEEEIKKGYEFVIKSRFDDARFYIDEDKKIKLSERIHLLEKIVFNEKFGSFYDRQIFVSKAADFIYAKTKLSSREKLRRAVMLSKADITTGLFREFPEYQGYIGMFYALQDGEDEEIAKAIYEHRLPEKQDDPIPNTQTGTVISIADKIIHIFSGFLSSLEVTSEEDPYGIRRAARNMIRVLIEKEIDIDIQELVDFLYPFFQEHLKDKMSEDEIKEKIINALEFIKERIENYLSSYYKKDIVRGVIERTYSPYDAFLKTKSLSENDFADLFYVARRVRNIIEQAEERGLLSITENPKPKSEIESKTYEEVLKFEKESIELLKEKKYDEFIKSFSKLRKTLDDFFNSVMILSENEEERRTRLSILYPIFEITNSFADFSKIEKRKA